MNITVERIKELAQLNGIKLLHITNQLGLSRTYFSDINAGKAAIPADRLAKIASILGTTPAYLLGESDEKSAAPDDEASKTAREIYLKMQTDPDFKKLVETARSLDPEKREELVKYMDYLQSQLDRKDKQ